MANAPAAALAFAATEIASNVVGIINNFNEERSSERVNKYNAHVTEESIRSLNYEEAMNETLARLNAYSEIGTGRNLMSSRGNIGSSADAAIINSYVNLAGDLSAMSFNYENRRWDLDTQRKNYLYYAKIAKAQKKNALIGGGLSVMGDFFQGVVGYKKAVGILNKTGNAFDKMQYLSANNLLP